MIDIRGIQKTSLVDYPPNITCTVFLGGCNFRCGFCHNPTIVNNEIPAIPEQEFFDFLEQRKNLLDAVCITGGEPTIQKYLPEFIMKIKKFGFKVKLDTNGTNPEMLANLIDNKLLDYIAMDLKGPLSDYEKICGCKVDIEKIKQSIEQTKRLFDYEFRLTVVPSYINKQNITQIGEAVKGCKRIYLQQFVSTVPLIDQNMQNAQAYTVKELEELKEQLTPYTYKIRIRGE